MKGFSVRDLKYMSKLAATYDDIEFVQTVSAQIPWSHNLAILNKVKITLSEKMLPSEEDIHKRIMK